MCFASETDKEYTLGLGLLNAPKYAGAKEYETKFFPVIKVEYGRFSLGAQGLGYDIFNNEDSSFGLSVGYFNGRDESDARVLRGLGDINSSAHLGAFAKKSFGKFKIAANVQRDFSDDSEGVTFELSSGYTHPINKRLMLSAGLSLNWVDDNYATAFYGVTAQQASASAFNTFSAQSGFEKVSASLAALFFLDKHWTLMSAVNVGEYLQDAKESPITRDETPVTVMATAAYRF